MTFRAIIGCPIKNHFNLVIANQNEEKSAKGVNNSEEFFRIVVIIIVIWNLYEKMTKF